MDLKPKGLIKRVLDFAVAEFERRSRPPAPAYGESALPADPGPMRSSAQTPTETLATTRNSEPPSRPAPAGLHLARGERGLLKVRWSVAAEELQRSTKLLEDGAVLCLRVVSFSAQRDHVTREVQDRPSVSSQGECEIARPDGGRAIVALGLRAGGRFVSIAHHIV